MPFISARARQEYISRVHGIVFLIDAFDEGRFEEMAAEFKVNRCYVSRLKLALIMTTRAFALSIDYSIHYWGSEDTHTYSWE